MEQDAVAKDAVEIIRPDWPAPANICAASTTRAGGVSTGPYASLNLGSHVSDDAIAVAKNRAILQDALGLADAPRWLEQVHGVDIVAAEKLSAPVPADGAITADANVICVVMTADCLPVLLCDRSGTQVAAVHGGWRGLAAGVLEAAVVGFDDRGVRPRDILCWLGPAISQPAYEVGADVWEALNRAGDTASLKPNRVGRWQLDLGALARARLKAGGVDAIYGGGFCTHADAARFFSYRRAGACGRQATLIWRSH
jgi:YfiH family protein